MFGAQLLTLEIDRFIIITLVRVLCVARSFLVLRLPAKRNIDDQGLWFLDRLIKHYKSLILLLVIMHSALVENHISLLVFIYALVYHVNACRRIEVHALVFLFKDQAILLVVRFFRGWVLPISK